MKSSFAAACLTILTIFAMATWAVADDSVSAPPVLNVPEGFSIELAAGPPLVERPITAAFDDVGRLYVAESSGSNDPVEQQLAERPHRIVRLEDSDGDGKYDRRVVFADRMMFPEGTMFLDGSLYVSAPPSIWKLTDADGDGVAEQREEWFTGTLTGCANDLHGPYAGLDGWIYWCKGAFDEQTHQVNGREFKSRAAHIFRRRPDGTGIEPVMTGGMDNPVDVVFSPEGERIFSATFLESDGRRDGIAHAIYGGVYGKDHGVIEGHPRTGELLPALVLMSPAAPSGLERYESTTFGADFRNNLFAAQFNLRKVSRHALQPAGSSFASTDSDFVWSDAVDFHPTDVLMDADGSLLVVDTGGWYKLCCPTSQLWKPDVLGGIYRVRRNDAKPVADPRGLAIARDKLTVGDLWNLLGDARVAVRERAGREFAKQRNSAAMAPFLSGLSEGDILAVKTTAECDQRTADLARTWALVKLETPASAPLVRSLLKHGDPAIRQAALHGVSLHRDQRAIEAILDELNSDIAANRRVAAEALGRLGDPSVAPALLTAAATADDRILQHSITYALIELENVAATRAGLASDKPGTVAAALMALDQMPGGGVTADEVVPLLSSSDAWLQQSARWIVGQHAEWGAALAEWFRAELEALADDTTEASDGDDASPAAPLQTMLAAFASDAKIQELIAATAVDQKVSPAARQLVLRVMEQARIDGSAAWAEALAAVINERETTLLPLAVAAARRLPPAPAADAPLPKALRALAEDAALPADLRVTALATATMGLAELSDGQFELLAAALSEESAVGSRAAAADAISQAPLTAEQLERLCDAIGKAGPLELNKLLTPFARSTSSSLGSRLLAALGEAPALSSLRLDLLKQALAGYNPAVQEGIAALEAAVNVDATAQRARIDELMPHMASGDVRRGHAVFHSTKASCSACHRMGYAGGTTGPELSRIGESRTERDLLEAILFPSLSFVRSYEPILLVTTDGRAVGGVIRDETEREYIVATGPNEEARVARDEVEEIQPNTVSIMPAGLDKQLTVQELADLVAFLRNAK